MPKTKPTPAPVNSAVTIHISPDSLRKLKLEAVIKDDSVARTAATIVKDAVNKAWESYDFENRK